MAEDRFPGYLFTCVNEKYVNDNNEKVWEEGKENLRNIWKYEENYLWVVVPWGKEPTSQ